MILKKSLTRAFFVPILFNLVFSGCNARQSPSTSLKGDVLKLLYWQAPTILNPYLYPSRQQIQIAVKETLQSIGVGVELKVIDPSVFFSSNSTNNDTTQHFFIEMNDLLGKTFKGSN